MNAQPTLLGIAASLRNARWGAGNRELISQLSQLSGKESMFAFLKRESELHLENFVAAGRKEGKAFTEIYANLRKSNGEVGLSNTEVALAGALWAAKQEGIAIDHLSLTEFFTANNEVRSPDELSRRISAADGLLISGPVYFGDRGSLAESLIDFIAADRRLAPVVDGKLYGGIAVGAKRNGGQETTLIYQMLDMVELGFVAVGNDHETTAQYGGTGHAGDVGTMHKDSYGLETSLGVGRRMARVLKTTKGDHQLLTAPRVLFLILRDSGELALGHVKRLASRFKNRSVATILDITQAHVKRCIACDICPTHIDVDEQYRCIIKSKSDDFETFHKDLLHHDLIVPVVAAVHDRNTIISNYQSFIERTRYLRRGDYALSDTIVSPLMFEDAGVRHSYGIRMMTSLLRHHTILSRPIVGSIKHRELTNEDQVDAEFARALSISGGNAAGRLGEIGLMHATKYKPVGYVLSADKELEDERLHSREKMVQARERRLANEAIERLARPELRRTGSE
jgi:multimeric flavodoxin WrbA